MTDVFLVLHFFFLPMLLRFLNLMIRLFILQAEKDYTSNGPKSPWVSFASLFQTISGKISSKDMNLVCIHYEMFKCPKLAGMNLLRSLLIVGDQFLKSKVANLQAKVHPTNARP
ncbi:hypothetical protein M9H77_03504 [Catharanthus roseus]|uniref:Uncharacterized protein n=1 Tax=Catharanthus roseus TaxID=4058 RepID=A0ACC0CBH5_CATRO|nr:hypothetical protein M9H77_03504 [Catharanthus roseus]